MTTPEPGPRGGCSLPPVPDGGRFTVHHPTTPALTAPAPTAPALVAYAFSERADGTMSDRVGEGDHLGARTIIAARVGVTPSAVAWMEQVHGDVVTVVGAPAAPAPTCDGIVSTAQGVAAAVVVADCVPVLMASPRGVAAAHAGRPGVVADVSGRTLDRLCEQTGDAPADVDVVIGPAIGPCCYEVPEAMAADAAAAVPGTRATTTWGTPSIDLVAGVVGQLRARGVDRIVRAGGCTRCTGTRWFSHRASGGPEGRPPGRQAGIVVRLAPAGASP